MLKNKKKSLVTITLQGVNLNRILNEITNTTTIRNITRLDSTTIQFSLPSNKLDYLIAKYNNSCYTINIVGYSTYFNISNLLFSRFGLVLGVICTSIILFIINLFCLGCYIQCEDDTTSTQINNYLNEHNIVGQLFTNINYPELEHNILQSCPSISLIDVSRRGVYLVINVTLAVPPTPSLDTTSNQIIATQDGIITRMHIISGTPLVSIGDVVHKGQVLIDNSYTDIFGNLVECEAKGTIFAKHWYSSTVDYPLHSIEYARSGEVITQLSIVGLGVNIPINNVDIPTQNHEVECTYTYLTPTLGIPIKLQTTNYYVLEQIELDNDFERDKDAVIFEAKELVSAKVDTSMVTDQKYTISLVGDIYFVTYYMCVEIQIT